MLEQFGDRNKLNKYKAAFIFLCLIGALIVVAATPPKTIGIDELSNQLKPCPKKLNCINTEYSDDTDHYAKPLFFPADKATDILKQSKNIILSMGGEIEKERVNYIHATFTSKIFRFVDDFEIRIDDVLHIRSASRIGSSDFGVNKERVELFTLEFKKTYPD
ncbi:MAG: DUF1499 domain-containing protein [Gammaproteobacteria bacterium]|nr:DUF1499 domain-containing protein [Gammaproteobacteria bacterium]